MGSKIIRVAEALELFEKELSYDEIWNFLYFYSHGNLWYLEKILIDRYCNATIIDAKEALFSKGCVNLYFTMVDMIWQRTGFSTPEFDNLTTEFEYEIFLSRHGDLPALPETRVNCDRGDPRGELPVLNSKSGAELLDALFSFEAILRRIIVCGSTILAEYMYNQLFIFWKTVPIEAFHWNSMIETLVFAAKHLEKYVDMLSLYCTSYVMTKRDDGWFRNDPEYHLSNLYDFVYGSPLKNEDASLNPSELADLGWLYGDYYYKVDKFKGKYIASYSIDEVPVWIDRYPDLVEILTEAEPNYEFCTDQAIFPALE